MNKTISIAAIIVVLVGAGSFYGGMKYAQNQAATSRQQFTQQFRGGSGGAGGAGVQRAGIGGAGGFVTGDIISKDDKSITVKLNDGGSKIVFFSDSTNIGTIAKGQSSDLVVGKQVSINGSANSDGSVTAQMIQLRP